MLIYSVFKPRKSSLSQPSKLAISRDKEKGAICDVHDKKKGMYKGQYLKTSLTLLLILTPYLGIHEQLIN